MPMPRPAQSGRQAGFTLVELLAAIAVMALLALMSWRGLDAMVRSQEATRRHSDDLMVMQTVLAQWSADLDAVQAIDNTTPIDWDGQMLRLTRHGTREPDEGAVVVAWARQDGQWVRWQSPAVRTRSEWSQAWQRAALWARSPSASERSLATVLLPVLQWQLFYHRGGTWFNALSSGAAASAEQSVGGLSTAAASIPDGIRLQLTLPAGGALSGTLTMDWVHPILGGNKS